MMRTNPDSWHLVNYMPQPDSMCGAIMTDANRTALERMCRTDPALSNSENGLDTRASIIDDRIA